MLIVLWSYYRLILGLPVNSTQSLESSKAVLWHLLKLKQQEDLPYVPCPLSHCSVSSSLSLLVSTLSLRESLRHLLPVSLGMQENKVSKAVTEMNRNYETSS